MFLKKKQLNYGCLQGNHPLQGNRQVDIFLKLVESAHSRARLRPGILKCPGHDLHFIRNNIVV